MSYSIIRVAKVKSSTNTTGLQKHIQRENKNYENKDIDHSKTYLNYDLVNANKQKFNDLIEEKIEQNYTDKRKIRTDAIKHVDGLITSDNEFFNNQTPEDTKQFFERAKEFLEQEYGKDNLLYATVHMDEKTPHMHYGIVPITKDGRLSAKEVVGNKKSLTELQNRFNEYVNQHGYDLERGESKQLTSEKHDQLSRYKQKTEYHKQEYERESQKLSHIQQKSNELIEQYQKSLETLKKPLNVQYEHETEKLGGLFNKEVQETGNVVISQEDFNIFQKQIEAAQTITEDYERIKSGEELKSLQETRKNFYELYSKYEELQDDNKKMKSKLDENQELGGKVLTIAKLLYAELLKVLGREKVVNKINSFDLPEKEKQIIKSIDKNFYPEKYQEQKSEQKGNRGRGR
ncbi:TPA: plasmid recombination protein [Staphylococcus aureus]|nr:plasmid recombination protein [Staphylococcus aureus]